MSEKRYRISVMEVEILREKGTLRKRYTPAGAIETVALTPWDAVVKWADEIKQEEAS